MNYHVLVGLIIWWSFLGLFFTLGSMYLLDASISADLNQQMNTYSNTSYNETGQVQYVSPSFLGGFVKLLGFIFFGIGLPADTPLWFAVMFGVIETSINIIGLSFIAGFIRGS